MSDLIDRLRGKYPVGPIGEDGQPEFGYRDFSNAVSAIQLEAADRIESLEAERDGLYRQLEKAREERNAARVKYEQPLLARVAELISLIDKARNTIDCFGYALAKKLDESEADDIRRKMNDILLGLDRAIAKRDASSSSIPEQSRAEIEAGALERWANSEKDRGYGYFEEGYNAALKDAKEEAARIRAEGNQ